MVSKELQKALKEAHKVIGLKQVTKAVNKGKAAKVFLAQDADERITAPVKELCLAKGIELDETVTMAELGEACAIEVGAAAAAMIS